MSPMIPAHNDRLKVHNFMNSRSVRLVHLVKLNATNPAVGKHESTTFQGHFSRMSIVTAGGETYSEEPLPVVDTTRRNRRYVC
jgi:hypothetical protein